jgi:hypothetical protein
VLARRGLISGIRELQAITGGVRIIHPYLLIRGLDAGPAHARQNDNGVRLAAFLEARTRRWRASTTQARQSPEHAVAGRQMEASAASFFGVRGDRRLRRSTPAASRTSPLTRRRQASSSNRRDELLRELTRAITGRHQGLLIRRRMKDAGDLIADLEQALEQV